MTAAIRLKLYMMEFDIPRVPTSGHRAAVVIAREHLLAHAWSDRARRPPARRAIDVADDRGIAHHPRDGRIVDVDLDARTVLRRALAVATRRVTDLRRRL